MAFSFSDLMGTASSLYGLYNAHQQQNMGRDAIRSSDPFGSQRGYYADRLRQLSEHPETMQDEPGYKFQFDQGQQAVERSMAAQGFSGSGNAAIALTQYGQNFASNWYDRESKFLSQLAGAGISPNPGPGMNEYNAGVSTASDSLSSLGYLANKTGVGDKVTDWMSGLLGGGGGTTAEAGGWGSLGGGGLATAAEGGSAATAGSWGASEFAGAGTAGTAGIGGTSGVAGIDAAAGGWGGMAGGSTGASTAGAGSSAGTAAGSGVGSQIATVLPIAAIGVAAANFFNHNVLNNDVEPAKWSAFEQVLPSLGMSLDFGGKNHAQILRLPNGKTIDWAVKGGPAEILRDALMSGDEQRFRDVLNSIGGA